MPPEKQNSALVGEGQKMTYPYHVISRGLTQFCHVGGTYSRRHKLSLGGVGFEIWGLGLDMVIMYIRTASLFQL